MADVVQRAIAKEDEGDVAEIVSYKGRKLGRTLPVGSLLVGQLQVRVHKDERRKEEISLHPLGSTDGAPVLTAQQSGGRTCCWWCSTYDEWSLVDGGGSPLGSILRPESKGNTIHAEGVSFSQMVLIRPDGSTLGYICRAAAAPLEAASASKNRPAHARASSVLLFRRGGTSASQHSVPSVIEEQLRIFEPDCCNCSQLTGYRSKAMLHRVSNNYQDQALVLVAAILLHPFLPMHPEIVAVSTAAAGNTAAGTAVAAAATAA